ncbi:hypothetical protein DL770_008467 [Monosporascus sp. CRB-9-2]|nr:hypothetical protein DL770_008467 [Monosporascus sp. CRB-9-2]
MEAIASNLRQYAVIAAVSLIVWQAATAAYNLFLHPLRRFPGPLANRASPLPWALRHALGRQAFATQRLHERYGPVVRVGPGHLSFTDPRAWRDIYGRRVGDDQAGSAEMPKSRIFVAAIRDLPSSIINADREEHARLRRALSHGFSDASIREQEPLITRYIDLLLKRLGQECRDGSRALNMEAWYNYTTFDVVGDLVFGHSFSCLESVEYHPWISFIMGSVRSGARIVALSYVGLDAVVQWMWRYGGFLAFAKMQGYIDKMLASRLGMEKDRSDLFEGLVKRREEWNLSFEKLGSNAFILILGGSETTATTLSGATYLLLTHPEVLEKLNHEVRSAFASADEITISSVGKLSYMLAVLNESLRLYPPVMSGLVRVVPPGGEEIAGHWVPGGTFVEVQHWSINHSKDNWEEPWAFKPERFLRDADGAAGSGDRLDALQPFIVGPRNCIGRNLAYAEMRMILARIVYDFDMKLADDSKDWIKRQKAFGLWDKIPLNVYLTPVQRRKEAA